MGFGYRLNLTSPIYSSKILSLRCSLKRLAFLTRLIHLYTYISRRLFARLEVDFSRKVGRLLSSMRTRIERDWKRRQGSTKILPKRGLKDVSNGARSPFKIGKHKFRPRREATPRFAEEINECAVRAIKGPGQLLHERVGWMSFGHQAQSHKWQVGKQPSTSRR